MAQIKYFKISKLSAIDKLDDNDLLLVADKSNEKNGLSAYTRNLSFGGLHDYIAKAIARKINERPELSTSLSGDNIAEAIDDRFEWNIENSTLSAGDAFSE